MPEPIPCQPDAILPLPPVETTTVLVGKFMLYLTEMRGASVHTIRGYRSELDAFTQWLWGHMPAAVADPAQLDHRCLRAYVAYRSGTGLANASIQRVIATLRSLCRYLMATERIFDNPAAMLRCKRTPRPLPRYLEQPEALALIGEPDGYTFQELRARAVLEVLYSAGLRVGELVGLDDAAVDWERGVLRVRGKGKRERLAVLGKPALDALCRYREARGVRHGQLPATNGLIVAWKAPGKRLRSCALDLFSDSSMKTPPYRQL